MDDYANITHIELNAAAIQTLADDLAINAPICEERTDNDRLLNREPMYTLTDIEMSPKPNANGMVIGRDKRKWHMPTGGYEAFAKKLNARYPKVRLDESHTSEKPQQFIKKPAAAWLSNWHPAANGTLIADIEIYNYNAAHLIATKNYRYLSPAYVIGSNNEIADISSVGLVNEPNLRIKALNNAVTGEITETETQTTEGNETMPNNPDTTTVAAEDTAAQVALNEAQEDSLLKMAMNNADGGTAIIITLLKFGTNPAAKNNNGKTP